MTDAASPSSTVSSPLPTRSIGLWVRSTVPTPVKCPVAWIVSRDWTMLAIVSASSSEHGSSCAQVVVPASATA